MLPTRKKRDEGETEEGESKGCSGYGCGGESADGAEEVEVEVEAGKKRKVVGWVRFRGGSASAGGVDVEVSIQQLRGLSKQDRGRCVRCWKTSSDTEVSSLEGDAGKIGNMEAVDEQAETRCG